MDTVARLNRTELLVRAATEPLESALTAQQLAGVLFVHGARGERGSFCTCALTTYVRQRLTRMGVPTPHRVDVFPGNEERTDRRVVVDISTGSQEIRVEFGPAVADFVDAFDAGEYPELERKEDAS